MIEDPELPQGVEEQALGIGRPLIVSYPEAGAVLALAVVLQIAGGGHQRREFVGGNQLRALAAGGIEVVERFLLAAGSGLNVGELASVRAPLHSGGRAVAGSRWRVDCLHGVLLFG